MGGPLYGPQRSKRGRTPGQAVLHSIRQGEGDHGVAAGGAERAVAAGGDHHVLPAVEHVAHRRRLAAAGSRPRHSSAPVSELAPLGLRG
jgi:hypothetical protein